MKRRQGCEQFKAAILQGDISPQTVQTILKVIEEADASMVQANNYLKDLEKRMK